MPGAEGMATKEELRPAVEAFDGVAGVWRFICPALSAGLRDDADDPNKLESVSTALDFEKATIPKVQKFETVELVTRRLS